jgi:hypothetical protein
MRRAVRALLCAALASGVIATACSDGDDDGDKTPVATARATSTAGPIRSEGRVTAAAATPSAASEPTAPPQQPNTPAPGAATQPPTGSAPPPPPPPPAATGRVWTLAEAQALLGTAPLTPGDLSGAWEIGMDIAQDNATAGAADPRGAASYQRCGRLSGRLLTNAPVADQLVSRYLGGESVAFFTQLTVYATAEGAADCAIEGAIRYSEPGELAKAFGEIFVKTVPVVVAQVAYPQIADGAIAWTLAGKTAAQGLEVDLKILVVAFRKGNVTAVVGSAAAFDPSVAELTPHVNTVLARITAAQ